MNYYSYCNSNIKNCKSNITNRNEDQIEIYSDTNYKIKKSAMSDNTEDAMISITDIDQKINITPGKIELKNHKIFENQDILTYFNTYNDFMTNVNVSMSDMWAAGLSQLSTFIGSAGTVAFALGSAILSFLILLVFMIFFLLDGEKFTHSFMQAGPEEKNE